MSLLEEFQKTSLTATFLGKSPGRMYVVKRDGKQEEVKFDKITERISRLMDIEPPLSNNLVDPVVVAQKVVSGVFPGVKTTELDNLAAETAAYMSTIHPDYGILAARISISNLQKQTSDSFYETAKICYHYKNPRTKLDSPLYSKEVFEIIEKNAKVLDEAIDYNRDYSYDYFAFKTLERSYLFRVDGKIVERPQHMLMRVSVGIHFEDIASAIQTYELLSQKYFTHATPTLFNAGTPCPQMSSCFLLSMKEDSIEGIYDTLKRCALISKSAGGIGLAIHCIRAANSYIRGTNGTSNGLVPMLRVFNDTARYVDQCFTGQTLIYTSDGPLSIGQAKEGIQVLTHNGGYQPIEKVLKYSKQSKLLEIKVEHSLGPIQVTDQHPFLALKGVAPDLTAADIQIRLARGLFELEWTDASELQVNDLITFPIARTFVDLPWSEEDCHFYGVLCGSASISEDGQDCRIFLSESNHPEALQFVKEYLKEKNVSFYTCEENAVACKVISFNPQIYALSVSFRELLYDEMNEKNIHSSLLQLPKSKVLSLFKGLVETCGSISNEEIILETTCSKVVENIRYMLLRLGILTCGNSSSLRIPKTEEIAKVFGIQPSRSFSFFSWEGFAFTRIESTQELSESEQELFDLEVHKDHSYVTSVGTVHNGGGKRKGAFAVYLEPWHADIYEFLELRKNTGKEEQRARDLFYALWIPDLFMERVEQDSTWALFCPNEATGLHLNYGEEFNALYLKYENTPGLARKTVRARELWFLILESQIETGNPYIMYKDACNRKSNHKHLGTIQSSNLCTEIVEYTSPDEVAVCNLSSLALPKFIKEMENGRAFDHQKLYEVTKVAVRNLNKIIDRNYYPIEEAKHSNMRHRPVGLGVQGLADVFIKMRLPFDSEGARKLNTDIFETIYFAALSASKDIAKVEGTYPSYPGSPVSQGILQFDMWGVTPSSHHWDWDTLRQEIKQYGVRNSLLVAPMPTASTSQILGNNETFEPYTSNIYTRRVLSGEFTIVNRHLIEDLMQLNLWNPEIKNKIVAHNGSVQNIPEIPQDLKDLYKTVWEISMKTLIDLAADRGAYIDQSQSLNCFMAKPDMQKLTSMHFYGWKKGLKTGMYYLRTRPVADAIKFTVDQTLLNNKVAEVPSTSSSNEPPSPLKKQSIPSSPSNTNPSSPSVTTTEEDGPVCRMQEGCLVCGS